MLNLKTLLVTALFLSLTACGGSGSGSPSTPPTDGVTPPVVTPPVVNPPVVTPPVVTDKYADIRAKFNQYSAVFSLPYKNVVAFDQQNPLAETVAQLLSERTTKHDFNMIAGPWESIAYQTTEEVVKSFINDGKLVEEACGNKSYTFKSDYSRTEGNIHISRVKLCLNVSDVVNLGNEVASWKDVTLEAIVSENSEAEEVLYFEFKPMIVAGRPVTGAGYSRTMENFAGDYNEETKDMNLQYVSTVTNNRSTLSNTQISAVMKELMMFNMDTADKRYTDMYLPFVDTVKLNGYSVLNFVYSNFNGNFDGPMEHGIVAYKRMPDVTDLLSVTDPDDPSKTISVSLVENTLSMTGSGDNEVTRLSLYHKVVINGDSSNYFYKVDDIGDGF